MKTRSVIEQIPARPASDGDGVKLMRVFGGVRPERFDPFLMMDEFGSDKADDYIGGFPPHPHRGFETITYMLQGKMEHRDHMGNVGLLEDGDVQWMTAGRGVIHSEMPKQTEGKMRGFQIWLNLPSEKKMQTARYADISHKDIPTFEQDGVSIKAIAGTTDINGETVSGFFDVEDTQPTYLDVTLQAGKSARIAVSEAHTALVYVYEGEVTLGDTATPSRAQIINRMVGGDSLLIENKGDVEARVVVLSGKPLKEPVVQYGPFVMNTSSEIEQAIRDYQAGVLTD